MTKQFKKAGKGITEFVKEGYQRSKGPTPKWFRWLRWGASIFAGSALGISAAVTQPWSTVVLVLGSVAGGIAATTWFPVDREKENEVKNKME